MNNFSRREAIGSAAISAPGISLFGIVNAANAAASRSGGAFAARHAPKPLRFNPATLTGLSEWLIISHWENN